MRSVVRGERRGLSVPSAPHEHGLPLDALRLTGMLPALTTAGGPWRHSRESGNPGFWSWEAPSAARSPHRHSRKSGNPGFWSWKAPSAARSPHRHSRKSGNPGFWS